jgi:hypothetical protein
MSHHDGRTQLLLDRLAEAGLVATSVSPAGGGVVAVAGLASLTDGSRVFAKTLAVPDATLFPIEALRVPARRIEELARPVAGWRDWAPILRLREILSVVAHGDDDWGAAAEVRKLVAPFRRSAG